MILWASGSHSDEVAAMEQRRFPKLKIVKGTIGVDGQASNQDLGAAIAWTDFLLHGSGPSLVAAKDVAAFVKHTRKPFGVYGITHGSFLSGNDTELLSQAEFVYFRDSVSLEHAKRGRVTSPIMEFGPDGAFACDLATTKSNCIYAGKRTRGRPIPVLLIASSIYPVLDDPRIESSI